MSGQHEQQDGLEQSGRPEQLDGALIMTQSAGSDADDQNGHSYDGEAGGSRSAQPPQRGSRSVFDPIPPSDRSQGFLDPDSQRERIWDPGPGNGTQPTRNGVPHPEREPDQAAEPPLAAEVPDSNSAEADRTDGAGTQPIAAPSGSASRRHGRSAGDAASRRADQRMGSVDQPGPGPGSLADLRQRLNGLPYGHPSSPYHDDGERKPPPPRLKHLELAPPALGRISDRPPQAGPPGPPVADPAEQAFPADEPPARDEPASGQPDRQQHTAEPPPSRLPSRGRRARQAQPAASEPSSAVPDGLPSRREPTSVADLSQPAASNRSDDGEPDRNPARAASRQEPALPLATPGSAVPGPHAGSLPGLPQPRFTPAESPAPQASFTQAPDPLQPPAGRTGYPVQNEDGGMQPSQRRPTFTPAARAALAETSDHFGVPADQSERSGLPTEAKGASARRGPGFNPEISPPRMMPDGSWTWGPAKLAPDEVGVADDGYDRFRAAEGRDLFGSYVGSGLTAKLRQLEERLERGSLDAHTEDHALLDIDVFRARFAEMLRRHPDRSPELLAIRVPGALSYAFIFDVDQYADGIVLVQDALEGQGFELQARKNSWSSAANRCVFTMWHDPLSELPFEVQFHTNASFDAQQLARTSVNLINDPRIPREEAASLRSDLASAWAAVPSPPGNGDIGDYRRYGSTASRR